LILCPYIFGAFPHLNARHRIIPQAEGDSVEALKAQGDFIVDGAKDD
jgi:hypothetical protein